MRIIFKIKNTSEVRTNRIVLSFYLKTRKNIKNKQKILVDKMVCWKDYFYLLTK